MVNPPMASLLQQMSENPSMVQNMLSAPYTRSVLEALAADPNMANSLLADNPLLAGNPQLQEQMRTMMPQFIQQLQSPEMQNLMMNPQALNAIMQIQQGSDGVLVNLLVIEEVEFFQAWKLYGKPHLHL